MKCNTEELLGRIAVEKEFISMPELEEARSTRLTTTKSLGTILMEKKFLTSKQIERLEIEALEKMRCYDSQFIEAALNRDLVSDKNIEQAKEIQKRAPTLPLHIILVAEGLITPFQTEKIWESIHAQQDTNALKSHTTCSDTPLRKNLRSIHNRQDPFCCIGTVLNDKYQITEFIGKGGMGAVYVGKHRFLNKNYAIKLLPKDNDIDDVSLQRFINEGRLAASIQHPNVVRVYDVDESQNYYYIVMEYVAGDSLATCVKKIGLLNVADAIWVIQQVTSGLCAIHDQGLVHRDIKPANILISQNGEIKIGDFGIAKKVFDCSQLTAASTILGTPKFMSPEAITREAPLDQRSDIYSLGATFYYLITGEPCFQGSMSQLLYQIVNIDPTPPHHLNPNIESQISQIILKMMAKTPEKRYQNIREIQHIFEKTKIVA